MSTPWKNIAEAEGARADRADAARRHAEDHARQRDADAAAALASQFAAEREAADLRATVTRLRAKAGEPAATLRAALSEALAWTTDEPVLPAPDCVEIALSCDAAGRLHARLIVDGCAEDLSGVGADLGGALAALREVVRRQPSLIFDGAAWRPEYAR